ncbi:MAG: transcriptional regulator, TetR family [Phenylobacterium sp.]|nr:transcriptional regulator, TetR family [Phenylobacterium sp.]
MAERPNQRKRTRKDLLEAASRLMRRGEKPGLEEIAEEALVSRATAYRYFPSLEALFLEASVDVAFPDAGELFAGGRPKDVLSRVLAADAAVHDMVLANDAALRMFLAHSLERSVRDPGDLPPRQNRRTPLIEAALEPARADLDAAAPLAEALALLIGTEAMVTLRDVLQLDDARGRAVKAWAIEALVAAARRGKPPA